MRDYRNLYSRMSGLGDFEKRMLLLEVFNKFQTCEEIGYKFNAEEFFMMVHKELKRKNS